MLQAEKTVKFQKPKKHQTFEKKARGRLARRNAQTVGRIMEGEEDSQNWKKLLKKWKTEIEASDGEKNLEDLAGI